MFSGYDVFLTVPNDSMGTITVTCDTVPPPDVTVQIGPSLASGGFNPRQMRHVSGSDLLNYNLFTDAGRSAIWGDGTGWTSIVKRRVPRNKPWVTTVYGRVPAGQNVSVGLYSETVTVTIIW
jgi:spore coat protein U-like protein